MAVRRAIILLSVELRTGPHAKILDSCTCVEVYNEAPDFDYRCNVKCLVNVSMDGLLTDM